MLTLRKKIPDIGYNLGLGSSGREKRGLKVGYLIISFGEFLKMFTWSMFQHFLLRITDPLSARKRERGDY